MIWIGSIYFIGWAYHLGVLALDPGLKGGREWLDAGVFCLIWPVVPVGYVLAKVLP